ncbi:MAG: hypothetical protein ABIH68_06480 [bacterium]
MLKKMENKRFVVCCFRSILYTLLFTLYSLHFTISAAEEKKVFKRNVKLVLHKKVESVKVQGFLGRGERLMTIPMLKKGNEFYINLNLGAGFYPYRYLVDGERYITDPYNKEDIVQGEIKYSLLKVWPDNPELFLSMASDFIAKKKVEWAIDVYIEGIKTFPKEVKLYSALGEFYEGKKWFDFAADCYHSYLENDPEDAGMRYRIASCYEKFYLDTDKKKFGEYAVFHWEKLFGTKYEEEAKKHIKELKSKE